MKENLNKAIKKTKGKIINYLSPHLCIRHKPTKIEYTIKKIKIVDDNLVIIAYRYFGKDPDNLKKVYVEIHKSDFKNYEQV